MDLRWLDDVLILLEEKNMTHAAARRNITQPAFSRRIRGRAPAPRANSTSLKNIGPDILAKPTQAGTTPKSECPAALCIVF